jgi:carbonic anhydrase
MIQSRPSRSAFVATAAILAMLGAPPALAAEKGAHWGYKGDHGPTNWAKLHPNNKLCATGKRQSPFKVGGANQPPEKAGDLQYKATAGKVINNGHTIQVSLEAGSVLMVDGKPYRLAQFHFHTPSEHHLFNKGYPMEMHLVHVSADKKLAVVGVMIAPGGNGGHPLDKLALPAKKGATAQLAGGKIDPGTLLPTHRSHFRFEGSLTTPPCSEGVAWHMMITPIRLKAATIKRFQAIMGANNRPLQPHNNRKVSHRR